MRKTAALLSTLTLTACLFLVGSSPAIADDINLTGHWAGTWTCVASPDMSCDKPGGTMEGNLTQDGVNVSGNFILHNTVAGDLNCQCQYGTLTGNQLTVNLDCGEASAAATATINNNSNAQGSFTSGEMGNGTFDISRQ